MQDNHTTRNTFPDIQTKKLKQLYNDSRSIKTLRALWIVGIIAFLAIIGFVLFSPNRIPADQIPSLAIILPFIALNLATVIGCFRWATWGRILGIISCALALFGFPIGTLIGILGLVAFIRSPELFGPKRLDPAELLIEYKSRKKTAKAQQGS